jgi:5-methyltetrahydrofolate--homocysteine methyltransferase
MPLIVNELHRRKLTFPVLIGGAAINARFGWRILKCDDGELYTPGVYYCKDAFEGLGVMETLADPQRYQESLVDLQRKSEHEFTSERSSPEQRTSNLNIRTLEPAEFIPAVSEWGPRVVESMPIPLVADHLSLNELYRLSWGAKNTHGEEWQRLKVEFDARRLRMLSDAEKHGWLKPQGVYGYWPALADGNTLIIYDPASLGEAEPHELERLEFPRQAGGEGLSLADYFLPVGSGRFDVVALQVVTVGEAASQHFAELEAVQNYSEAYFVHGLAVQMAEAAADYLHDHIRRELGLQEKQGLRYSWGYPAIPDLSDHRKVFDLLPAGKALGMNLTPAYQLVPEQSTAAIIVHHPKAKYFNVGVNRVDQLLG